MNAFVFAGQGLCGIFLINVTNLGFVVFVCVCVCVFWGYFMRLDLFVFVLKRVLFEV